MDLRQAEREWMREWTGPEVRSQAYAEAMAAEDAGLALAIARFPLPKNDPDWSEEVRRDWGGRRELAALAAGDDARFSGFSGRWLAGQGWVRDGDRLLVPSRSLAVRNHSPSGFAWGYLGSGPAQLALALLLRATGRERAEREYQAFKQDVVAGWPGTGA